MFRPKPLPIQPGQESVWDYPRPPRVDPTTQHVRVEFGGVVIAETRRPIRILETSHPPTYYLPPEDCQMEYFVPIASSTFCEFKGAASYYDIRVGEKVAPAAAWYYRNPSGGFEAIKNYISLYPGRMDVCTIDGERVRGQGGGFYGGWITDAIVGPFKGDPTLDTRGW